MKTRKIIAIVLSTAILLVGVVIASIAIAENHKTTSFAEYNAMLMKNGTEDFATFATVNGEKIPVSVFEGQIKLAAESEAKVYNLDDSINNYIDRVLLRQEADRLGVVVPPDMIEAEVEFQKNAIVKSIEKGTDATMVLFLDSLSESDMTLDEYFKDVYPKFVEIELRAGLLIQNEAEKRGVTSYDEMLEIRTELVKTLREKASIQINQQSLTMLRKEIEEMKIKTDLVTE